MSQARVVALLQEAISLITGGETVTGGRTLYQPVFEVQAMGYSKIGAVESFRDELRLMAEPLARQFAEKLPVWWYVQDQEDYVRLSTEQAELQEFNCGNARFNIAIMGQAAVQVGERSTLWRTWWPAVIREYDEATSKMADRPLLHTDGAAVYAVANDSRTWGGQILSVNPRVINMDEVVRAAYNYFYLTNKDAKNPVESVYRRDGE